MGPWWSRSLNYEAEPNKRSKQRHKGLVAGGGPLHT